MPNESTTPKSGRARHLRIVPKESAPCEPFSGVIVEPVPPYLILVSGGTSRSEREQNSSDSASDSSRDHPPQT